MPDLLPDWSSTARPTSCPSSTTRRQLLDSVACVDFELDDAQRAWVAEVRQFLAENVTPALKAEMAEHGLEYQGGELTAFRRKIGEKGWFGLNWPTEYGGLGLTAMHQHLLMTEFEYAGVPGPDLTVTSIAPMIMRHGTEQNKKEFLPGIARGEIVFALGYSEPNAGTDLASLRTRAVRDGDEWVINGSKIWNSGAQRSTHEWLCVRTDPDAPRHRGISVIAVPVDSPGIDIRPLYAWSGYRTNETFFNDVRVPLTNLIGEVNAGWTYITGALDLERGALTNAGDLRRALDDLIAVAGDPGPVFRRRLAQAEADVEVAQADGPGGCVDAGHRSHSVRRGQRREGLHLRAAAADRRPGHRCARTRRPSRRQLLRAAVPGVAADALRRRHQ